MSNLYDFMYFAGSNLRWHSSWHHLDPKCTVFFREFPVPSKVLETHDTVKCAQTSSTIWRVLKMGGTPDHPSHKIILVYFSIETQVDLGIPRNLRNVICLYLVISASIFLSSPTGERGTGPSTLPCITLFKAASLQDVHLELYILFCSIISS